MRECQCRRGSGPFREVLNPTIELGGSDDPFNGSSNWGRKGWHLQVVCWKEQICKIYLPKNTVVCWKEQICKIYLPKKQNSVFISQEGSMTPDRAYSYKNTPLSAMLLEPQLHENRSTASLVSSSTSEGRSTFLYGKPVPTLFPGSYFHQLFD